MNYDGSKRRTVIKGPNPRMITHPFALSIFEDYIYFTDWSPGSIRRVNKFNGGSKRIFSSQLKKPMGIQVLHQARQPRDLRFKNYCEQSPCSHLCVLRPKNYACKCPFGFQLSADNKTCASMFLDFANNILFFIFHIFITFNLPLYPIFYRLSMLSIEGNIALIL